jgi:hypothetical protein
MEMMKMGPILASSAERNAVSCSRIALFVLSTVVLFVASAPASAVPYGYSESHIGSVSDYQDVASSSAFLNSQNFAESSAGPNSSGSLEGKAGLSSAIATAQARTDSTYNNGWSWCIPPQCGSISLPSAPAALTVNLSQDGYFTLNSSAVVGLTYTITSSSYTYSFNFHLNEDGPADFVKAAASLDTYDNLNHSLLGSQAVTVTLQDLVSNYYFSYDLTFDTYATYDLGYNEELQINASVRDGYIDSTKSFYASIVSPDYTLVSDDGRRIGPSAPVEPPQSVPEPGSALLLGIALLGLAGARKLAKPGDIL